MRFFRLSSCLALLLTTSFAVTELEDNDGAALLEDLNSPMNDGGANTHPLAGGGGEGTGYFKQADGVANFVGPRYGLPGYKESHAWEVGVDLFSPSIWNPTYYRVKYDFQGTHAKMQEDWLDKLAKNIAPDCPMGRMEWTLNKYAANNPSVASVKDENYQDTPATCLDMLKNFLTTGMYEGLSGQNGFPVMNEGVSGDGSTLKEPKVRFPLKAGLSALTGNDAGIGVSHMRPELTYTYTFWLRVTDRVSSDANILEFNTGDGQHLPTVSLSLQGGTTNLVYQVAQSDSPDYQCQAVASADSEFKPGFLELGKWHFITLAASKFHSTSSKMILYVDGEIGCEKENTSGTTMEPPDAALLYMSASGKPAAKAEVNLINFYPDYVLTAPEIAVQMKIEGEDSSFAPGPAMGPA